MKCLCSFLVVNLVAAISWIIPTSVQPPPPRLLAANLTKLPVVLTNDAGIQQASTISGQIVVRRFIDDRQRLALSFDSFNLLIGGIQGKRGVTGQISLRSLTPRTSAGIEQTSTGDQISVSLKLAGHYELIDRLAGYVRTNRKEVDEYPAQTEDFIGDLRGRLVLPRMVGGQDGSLTLEGDVRLEGRVIVGAVRKISISIRAQLIDLLFQICRDGTLSHTRSICVQPIYVRANAMDSTAAQEAYFATELTNANTLWARCCIRFDALPAVYVNRASLRVVTANADGTTSAEESDLLDEYSDDDCIEVFVIQSFDPNSSHGGGGTWSSGMAAAKIITAANNLPINQRHLAHELGHVLTLCHPGTGCVLPRVDGTAGSIMEPSGFFADNPDFQSGANCANVANPLLRSRLSTCCPNPNDA